MPGSAAAARSGEGPASLAREATAPLAVIYTYFLVGRSSEARGRFAERYRSDTVRSRSQTPPPLPLRLDVGRCASSFAFAVRWVWLGVGLVLATLVAPELTLYVRTRERGPSGEPTRLCRIGASTCPRLTDWLETDKLDHIGTIDTIKQIACLSVGINK